MPGQASEGDSNVAARRRGQAMLVTAAVLGAVWVYWVWLRATATPVPTVDLSHVEPLVADAVVAAQAGASRAPRSAEAWGRLGLTLHAHDFLVCRQGGV